MGIEDFCALEQADPQSLHKCVLVIDGQEFLKDSIVASILSEKHERSVTMRTLRARGVTLQDLLQPQKNFLQTASHNGDMLCKQSDLAACLFRANDYICLGILEILSFQRSGTKGEITSIGYTELADGGDKAVSVNAQIVDMTASLSDTQPHVVHKWQWNHCYISLGSSSDSSNAMLTQKKFIVRVPGTILFPLIPDVAFSTNPDDPPNWYLKHTVLQDKLESAWASLHPDTEEIITNLSILPEVKNGELPYSDNAGTTISYP